MRRHPFDPVALVFGLTFAGAGIVVLAGGSLSDEGHFLLPACLLGLGVALLVQNAARSRRARAAEADASGSSYGIGTSGLDDWSVGGWSATSSSLDDDWTGTPSASTSTMRTASGVEWTGPQDLATADEVEPPATETDTASDGDEADRPDDRAGD